MKKLSIAEIRRASPFHKIRLMTQAGMEESTGNHGEEPGQNGKVETTSDDRYTELNGIRPIRQRSGRWLALSLLSGRAFCLWLPWLANSGIFQLPCSSTISFWPQLRGQQLLHLSNHILRSEL